MAGGIPENAKFEALSPEKRFEQLRRQLAEEVLRNPEDAKNVVFWLEKHRKPRS